MIELYRTTYAMDRRIKAMWDRNSCDEIPGTLDHPRHYAYRTWECVARDFDPADYKAWRKILESLHASPAVSIGDMVFVDPTSRRHPCPKHPVGKAEITVYWLVDKDGDGRTRTLPLNTARDAWRDYWDDYQERLKEARENATDYKRTLRRPRTSRIGRTSVTGPELRETKDAYGIQLRNDRIETDAYDDIPKSRVRNKSWKEQGRYGHSWEKNLDKTKDGKPPATKRGLP